VNVDLENKFIDSVMILWSQGMNTADIAKKWVRRESDVERALHIGLERRWKKLGDVVERIKDNL
jgi:hypothetical protein